IIDLYRALQKNTRGSISGLFIETYLTDESSDTLSLFSSCISKDGRIIERDDEDCRANDYQAIVFKFLWNDISCMVRFELHIEYVTISSFIDLSVGSIDNILDLINNACNNHLVRDIYRMLFDLRGLISSSGTPVRSYEDIYNFLYYTIWDRWLTEILLNQNSI